MKGNPIYLRFSSLSSLDSFWIFNFFKQFIQRSRRRQSLNMGEGEPQALLGSMTNEVFKARRD
jgi:hypothetical protein